MLYAITFNLSGSFMSSLFLILLQENSDTESIATVASDAQIEEPHSFQKMVETLPGKLSKNMAANLSVPIAFVCLLHLANEKVKQQIDLCSLMNISHNNNNNNNNNK